MANGRFDPPSPSVCCAPKIDSEDTRLSARGGADEEDEEDEDTKEDDDDDEESDDDDDDKTEDLDSPEAGPLKGGSKSLKLSSSSS